MNEELKKPYNHIDSEGQIYDKWEKSGFFNPDNLPTTGDETFTILMPPTNANGDLHAGHGLVMTIEDIMTRYQRMRGKKTLWLPGNDHAGFETQVQRGAQLTMSQNLRLDIVMQVGAVQQEVTVASQATLVDTTSQTLSSLVDDRRVQDILRRLNIDLPVTYGLSPGIIASVEGPLGRVELR